MPRNYEKLEHQVLKAFQRALADERMDVADHLLYALEALDPEFSGASVRSACRSILHTTEDPQPTALKHVKGGRRERQRSLN
jgi:hypothetical protein